MEQPLLTIGAFARAVGLAPSTLRYYDECGLLRPAEVDDATGYRYYTPELERRAQAVAQMRDAGLSVEVMRTALDGTVEDRRRVLHEVLAEQEALAARRTALLENLLAEQSEVCRAWAITLDGPALAAAIWQVRAAADTDPASPLSGCYLTWPLAPSMWWPPTDTGSPYGDRLARQDAEIAGADLFRAGAPSAHSQLPSREARPSASGAQGTGHVHLPRDGA